MQFFVPNPVTDDLEEDYRQLAILAETQPDPVGSRVYSITWVSDGETWTATVGRTLSGYAETTNRRTRRVAREPRRTSLTVKAIFAPKVDGAVYIVITDGPLGRTKDGWANPIWTSKKPQKVEYFDAPEVVEVSEEA